VGAEQLQPIEWRVWAGKVEKEMKGGPYMGLEERMGFVDIRVCWKLRSRMGALKTFKSRCKLHRQWDWQEAGDR
jgi:hypothetical protein